MFEHFYSRRKTMQGAALPIALIFLFIITLTEARVREQAEALTDRFPIY